MGDDKKKVDPGPNFHASGTKTWEFIAASARDAFEANTGNSSTRWEAAVRQAVDEYLDERGSPDVDRWAGWVRPQDRPVEGVNTGGG